MGYSIYKVGGRWGGYGVPAICEHPDCNKEIDRGYSYACGGEPFSELGCDRYFCDEHLFMSENCRAFLCERCVHEEEPFPYKPETKEWVEHLLKDESWAEWRKNNPEEVKNLRKLYKIKIINYLKGTYADVLYLIRTSKWVRKFYNKNQRGSHRKKC